MQEAISGQSFVLKPFPIALHSTSAVFGDVRVIHRRSCAAAARCAQPLHTIMPIHCVAVVPGTWLAQQRLVMKISHPSR